MKIQVVSDVSRDQARRIIQEQLKQDLVRARKLRRIAADPHGRMVREDLEKFEASVRFSRSLLRKT